MKEGAARTSGPLFLYNVSELEKVPLTGPLARFPQGVEVGGCTIGISGPDLSSAAFRAGADIVRSESGGDGTTLLSRLHQRLPESPPLYGEANLRSGPFLPC